MQGKKERGHNMTETEFAVGNIVVSGRGLDALRTTRRWVSIYTVMLLIGLAMSVLVGLAAGFAGFAPMMPHPLPKSLRILYVAIMLFNVVVYSLFALFALQYRRGLERALQSGTGEDLTGALWAQRRFWTYAGGFVIALVALTVLAFIGAVVAGVLLAMHQHGTMGG